MRGLLRTASLLDEGAKAKSIIAARLFLLIDGDVGCAGVPNVRKFVLMPDAIEESGARDCDQMLTMLHHLTNRGQENIVGSLIQVTYEEFIEPYDNHLPFFYTTNKGRH